MSFQQMVGQFLMGPTGPVQSLLGGAVNDPAANFVGQGGRNLGRVALGLARSKMIETAFAVGIQPPGDAPPVPFSFLTEKITTPQIRCGITRTTLATRTTGTTLATRTTGATVELIGAGGAAREQPQLSEPNEDESRQQELAAQP